MEKNVKIICDFFTIVYNIKGAQDFSKFIF